MNFLSAGDLRIIETDLSYESCGFAMSVTPTTIRPI